jgi:hypothetical protein
MRWYFLVCTLFFSSTVCAQQETEKIRIARAIVTNQISQTQSEIKIDAATAKATYLAEIDKLSNQFKVDFGKNYSKLSSQKISDLVDRYFSNLSAEMGKIFENGLNGTDLQVQVYSSHFSEDELSEILRKKPEIINAKHQKFVQEILPMLASTSNFSAIQLGRKVGEGFVKLQSELAAENGKTD